MGCFMQAFICTEFEDLFTFLPQNQKIFHRMMPVSRVKDTLTWRICHRLPPVLNKDNYIFYNLNQTIKYLAFLEFNKVFFYFFYKEVNIWGACITHSLKQSCKSSITLLLTSVCMVKYASIKSVTFLKWPRTDQPAHHSV